MNSAYFYEDFKSIPEALLGVIVIYLLIIALTRWYGLRSFSKMTSFDFAITIAIGSLIASSVSTGKPSMLMGGVLIGFLYLFKWLINLLQFKSRRMEAMINNIPTLLMLDGEFIRENLDKTKVTEDEIRAKMREANVLKLSQVKAVVLETTGDVSVLHGSASEELEDYLLEGVLR